MYFEVSKINLDTGTLPPNIFKIIQLRDSFVFNKIQLLWVLNLFFIHLCFQRTSDKREVIEPNATSMIAKEKIFKSILAIWQIFC